MNALLIVAHGSRRKESNDEINTLTKRVAQDAGDSFDLVDAAFLELADPSIPEGIQSLIDRGATKVLVMPYFLAKGTHVAADIPAQVGKAASMNPEVIISVGDYLGSSDAMPSLLLELAQKYRRAQPQS